MRTLMHCGAPCNAPGLRRSRLKRTGRFDILERAKGSLDPNLGNSFWRHSRTSDHLRPAHPKPL
jgi:hypothetical protein